MTVGQKGRASPGGRPARGARSEALGFPTLRKTTHDLANHVLAMELRIQELLADPVCMAAHSETLCTLHRLALEAAESLRNLRSVVMPDSRPPAR